MITFSKQVLTTGFLIAVSASAASAFDRETTNALQACHNYVWAVPDYADLPNAAISVWPANAGESVQKVYWVVDWTDPDVRAAGQCEYANGEVVGYEPFD
jgi:hypothetical protein